MGEGVSAGGVDGDNELEEDKKGDSSGLFVRGCGLFSVYILSLCQLTNQWHLSLSCEVICTHSLTLILRKQMPPFFLPGFQASRHSFSNIYLSFVAKL